MIESARKTSRQDSPKSLPKSIAVLRHLCVGSCLELQSRDLLLEVFPDELGCGVSLCWMGPGLYVQNFRMRRCSGFRYGKWRPWQQG